MENYSSQIVTSWLFVKVALLKNYSTKPDVLPFCFKNWACVAFIKNNLQNLEGKQLKGIRLWYLGLMLYDSVKFFLLFYS